jgi:epoxide hydrolase-like predicted phosphatase
VKPYRALIFDCGGVIFHFSPRRVFDYWAKANGKDANSLEDKFEFGKTFKEFERGEIDAAVFRDRIMEMLDLKLSDEDFDNGWNSLYGGLVPGIEELLQDLKTRYRLVALTNTNEIHAKKWRVMCRPILHYFEKVFSSHEIHARKPERRSYETVLEYLDLGPDEVIFLDDNPEFVSAASIMHMESIHVTSFSQMVRALRNLGVEVMASQG